MKRNGMIAQVVFPLPVDRHFDYRVSAGNSVRRGCRVRVEFHSKERTGVVIGLSSSSAQASLKPVKEILDSVSSLDSGQLRFAGALAREYVISLGEAVFLMLPPQLRALKDTRIPRRYRAAQSQSYVSSFIKGAALDERFAQYKDAVRAALNEGSVLICVPRLSRLQQLQALFDDDLKAKLITVHSGLKAKDVYSRWLTIRRGNVLLAGIRSALFYHPADTRLIVVEDEESPIYFQPEKPYWRLVDVAVLLARQRKVPLILSGAFPSLYAYRRIRQGEISLKEKEERRAPIKVFDVRGAPERKRKVFTPFMIEVMRKYLDEGGRVLISWRKKSYASFLRCESCHDILACGRCSSFLTFSLKKREVTCSWCGYHKEAPALCESCQRGHYRPVGVGVERLEGMVRKIFPDYESGRIDSAAKNPRIGFMTFHEGAQGLAAPGAFEAALIPDADSLISQADYEATMRAFYFLKNLSARVKDCLYVFTRSPRHYLWAHAGSSWRVFYDEELAIRRKAGFPPYGSLVRVIIKGKREKPLLKKAREIYNSLNDKGVEVFGPLEETPFKVRDKYRYAVVAKLKNRKKAGRLINSAAWRHSSAGITVMIR